MEKAKVEGQKTETAKVIDLAVFDVLTKSNDGVELELMNPEDNATGTGVFLRVLGRDSDAFKEIEYANSTKKLNRMSRNGGKIVMDAKELADEGMELLAASVVSWSVGKEPWTGNIVFGGKTLECTKANVLELFRRVPSFKDQVDIFVGDRANFLQGSPQS